MRSRWIILSVVVIAVIAGVILHARRDQRTPDRLDVSPKQLNLAVINKPVPLTAQLLDKVGRAIDGAEVAWSSSDDKVVTVDGKGSIQAHLSGMAQVIARSAGKEASSAVDVKVPGKMTIHAGDVSASTYDRGAVNFRPDTSVVVTVDIGDDLPLSAELFDQIERPLEVPKVEYRTNDPSVAIVSKDGTTLSGIRAGVTVLVAEYQGLSRKIMLAVTPMLPTPIVRPDKLVIHVGETRHTQASVKGGEQQVYPPTVFAFRSENKAVALANIWGDVTGVAPGKTTVDVTLEYGTAAIDVTVVPDMAQFQSARGAPPLVMTPAKLSMKVGESKQLSAILKTAGAHPLAPDALTYWSTSPEVALASTRGVVFAQKAGTALVGVASGDSKAVVEVTVQGGPAKVVTAGKPAHR